MIDAGVNVRRKIQSLGENETHPMAGKEEFVVRREVREFLVLLADFGEGEITNLEIRDGLPISFEVLELLTA